MANTVLYAGKFLTMYQADNGWQFVSRTKGGNAVFVLGITNANNIILVSEYRTPIASQQISLPAGLVADIDDTESVYMAALKELYEEAGYSANSVTELCIGPSSAGLTSELYTICWAKGLTKTGPGGGTPGENITVYETPLKSLTVFLNQQMAAGVMVEPKIYAALFLWQQLKQKNFCPTC